MDNRIKVWTKQHANILDDFKQHGRYIVKKEYIENKMEEHAGIYLDVYNWYFHTASKIVAPPPDVQYPVWVSLTEEEKIGNSDGNVLLELLVEKTQLITMDIDKWGKIVNFMYIPHSDQDQAAHEKLLKSYRIDDSTAYMTPFYPSIKNKIIKSWDLLFDETVVLSPVRVGTIWEMKEEWIVKITK